MDVGHVDAEGRRGGHLFVAKAAFEVLRFLVRDEGHLVVEAAVAVVTEGLHCVALLLLPHPSPAHTRPRNTTPPQTRQFLTVHAAVSAQKSFGGVVTGSVSIVWRCRRRKNGAKHVCAEEGWTLPERRAFGAELGGFPKHKRENSR